MQIYFRHRVAIFLCKTGQLKCILPYVRVRIICFCAHNLGAPVSITRICFVSFLEQAVENKYLGSLYFCKYF